VSAIASRNGQDILALSMPVDDLVRTSRPRRKPASRRPKGKDRTLGACYSAPIGLPRMGGAIIRTAPTEHCHAVKRSSLRAN
jgi:hypothetical protein